MKRGIGRDVAIGAALSASLVCFAAETESTQQRQGDTLVVTSTSYSPDKPTWEKKVREAEQAKQSIGKPARKDTVKWLVKDPNGIGAARVIRRTSTDSNREAVRRSR